MSNLHPDSTVIDRIGREVVRAHFLVTRQTVWGWRTRGVPAGMRAPLALLGESLGVDISDFPTSADPAMSPALPA